MKRTMALALVVLATLTAAPVVAKEPLGGAGTVGIGSDILTVEVTRGLVDRTVDSVGELKSARSSTVNSPFDGKVVKLLPEGTGVKKDDPVIWMDTQQLDDKLKEQESELSLAKKDLEAAHEEYRLQEIQNEYSLKSEQARVELAEQKLKDSEQKYASEKILVEKKISARTRLDEAQLAQLQSSVELRNARINLKKTEENLASNLRVKKNGIERAEIAVQRNERDLKDTKERIEKAILRAPVSGEVTYLKIWKSGTMARLAEGDGVWPNLSLAEIPDRSEMLAVIPVNELDVAAIEPGQKAFVTLDALPGRVLEATVARRSLMPIDTSVNRRFGGGGSTNSGGPREFEVEVKIDKPDPQLFQGMTATVRIQVAKADDALRVPIEALTIEGEEVGVFRAGAIKSEFVPVKVTLLNDRTAAVEGSLNAGDRIYLRHPNKKEEEARQAGFAALKRVQAELRPKATPAPAEAAPPADGGRPS